MLDKRNIAEPGRENSVLGAADTPIGTKLGELSPRGAGHSKGHRKSALAPLNGSSDDGDVMNNLPPLNGKYFHCQAKLSGKNKLYLAASLN